jgi:hypothetical protein
MSRLSLVLLLLLAACDSASRRTARSLVDEGYLMGSADAVKRLYWAKQALEAPSARGPAGRVMYYTWADSGTAADGRRLSPDTVAVPVFVPSPAPAGASPP